MITIQINQYIKTAFTNDYLLRNVQIVGEVSNVKKDAKGNIYFTMKDAGAALAAQDMVKSILSGIAILSDKPFVIGDWIEVDQFQGTVIDITFRSTRIKSYNNAVITIPNSTITSNYVVNWNRLTSRRFDCVLNLTLDTPSEKIKKIVKEIKLMLQNDPKVIKETVEVTLNEIASSSCNVKIFLYVREAEYAKFLHAKQDILCNLLYLFEKENVELAYPTQTLFVRERVL